jgi:hypothetical protein
MTTAVGIWVLSHGHAQEISCNAAARHLGASASGLLCPRAVSTYLVGVTLTTGGLIIVCLLMAALVKQVLKSGAMDKAPAIPTPPQHVMGTSFGSEQAVTTPL